MDQYGSAKIRFTPPLTVVKGGKLRFMANLQVVNARIWTGDPGQPWAGAVVIRDGRFTTVTPLEAAAAVRDTEKSLATLDLGGAIVLPGLIDAHLHVLMGGESLSKLDLTAVSSREEFEDAIARHHRALPSDRWLLAHGWSEENWGGEEPSKAWLAAAGDRPAVCTRMDLHAAIVNQAVLDQCDLKSDVPGGRIVRDASTGEPTGLLVEGAAWQLVNPILPRPSAEEAQQHLWLAQEHLHRLGVTAVGSMEYQRQIETVYEPLIDELTLRCRLTVLDRDWPIDCEFGRQFPARGHDPAQLAVIGYKAFADGTLGSRTAALLEDYADDPGNCGLLIELAREGHLCDWAQTVSKAGLSPSIHAIGDHAVRLALDALEDIGPERRPRIEHAQQIDPADLTRFAGRIASMQPLHKADDGRYAARRLGNERLTGFFPFRQLIDVGAHLAFGSDWPVVSCDPMLGVRAAVTGLTLAGQVIRPEENLTVDEAFRAYTDQAAYALGFSDLGRIAPGYRADLTVLDRDPWAIDWAQETPRVVRTIIDGHTVMTSG
ncbi:MAG: amidohydrolase [Phycisphaerales bacterium]|nr:MAG: amidohydrolase [Phycisphaerales bacterium]